MPWRQTETNPANPANPADLVESDTLAVACVYSHRAGIYPRIGPSRGMPHVEGAILSAKPSGRPRPKPTAASIGTGWKARLLTNQRGDYRAVVANAIIALRNAPEWRGRLHFDESALAITVKRPPPLGKTPAVPFTWADEHDVLAAAWLQHQGISVNKEIAGQAVHAVATGNNTQGRVTVVFRGKWAQATDISRTNVQGLELVEVA